jgi:hypothetical protein
LYVPASEQKVLTGSQITPEMTAPIRPGVTTRTEVIQLLGKPMLDLPVQRISAYPWEVLSGYMAWALPAPGAAGVVDVGQRYVLLIAFDTEERVVKFERTTQSAWVSASEHALKWAEQNGLIAPPAATSFGVRAVPPDKSLLYVYRSGGFWDRPDFGLPPPEVHVNGTLLGGLRKGEYRAHVVEPGTAVITVDSLPIQSLKAGVRYSTVTSLSVEALPGRAHYVEVRVQYGRGNTTPVLTECEETVALPQLKERQLAP